MAVKCKMVLVEQPMAISVRMAFSMAFSVIISEGLMSSFSCAYTACPTCGSCSGMYTANSMNCLTETIGMSDVYKRQILYRAADSQAIGIDHTALGQLFHHLSLIHISASTAWAPAW